MKIVTSNSGSDKHARFKKIVTLHFQETYTIPELDDDGKYHILFSLSTHQLSLLVGQKLISCL